jgi:nucleotide-binding universal stress UspA family protein
MNAGVTVKTGQAGHVNQGSGTVVVGVDGSFQARSALKWAADEAGRRGSMLRILCAEIADPAHLPPWFDPKTSDVTGCQAIVDDAEGLVATGHPSVFATAEVMDWPAAVALTEASGAADLLVVGSRGSGPFQELLLGSVSDQCIQYAHCPVVVVHTDADGPPLLGAPPRIVVGVDGSLASTRSLRWALEEAQLRAASVSGVFAWEYPPVPELVEPIQGYEVVALDVVDAAIEYAERFAPQVPFVASARLGDPVTVLLGESRDADLLVMGASGHGSFRNSLLGSVAHQCVRHANSDVVVVRSKEGVRSGFFLREFEVSR